MKFIVRKPVSMTVTHHRTTHRVPTSSGNPEKPGKLPKSSMQGINMKFEKPE